MAGNCFARSIEKALRLGEKTVLSSPYNPAMPGDAVKQFQRYNIFNLDIATNEILWATQKPEAVDQALIRVGEELIDMQLHFSVAYPPDEMRRIRSIYNASYAAVAEADVVVGIVGGMRQWYDTQCGIYINVQPTRRMVADYPGRFELHELDSDDIAAGVLRFRAAVRACNSKAQILIAVSPVSQPSTVSTQDSLIAQFYSKSVLRVGVEKVLQEFDDVEYIAALETALLSDFKYTYLETSPNHTKPNLGLRVTADFLRQRGDVSASQQMISVYGYATDLIQARDCEEALRLLEPMVLGETRPRITRRAHIELHRMYLTALMSLGRHAEAVPHVTRILSDPDYVNLLERWSSIDDEDEDDESGANETSEDQDEQQTTGRVASSAADIFFRMGRSIFQNAGKKSDFDFLTNYAESRGYEATGIVPARMNRAERDVLSGLSNAFRAANFPAAIEQAVALDPLRIEMEPYTRRKLDSLALQSHLKSGQAAQGIERLIGHLTSDGDKADARTATVLCNVGRSHATPAQLPRLIDIAQAAKLGDVLLSGLQHRQGVLARRSKAAG